MQFRRAQASIGTNTKRNRETGEVRTGGQMVPHMSHVLGWASGFAASPRLICAVSA